jgi:hypothetical protein
MCGLFTPIVDLSDLGGVSRNAMGGPRNNDFTFFRGFHDPVRAITQRTL